MVSALVADSKIFVGTKTSKIFIFELASLTLIKQIKITSNCSNFMLFNKNILLCAQSEGYIGVLRLSDATLIKTNQMEGIGNIFEMCKTSKANEIAIASETGLYFATITINKGNYNIQTSFEMYMKDKKVRGVTEFAENYLVVCAFDDINITVIDRNEKRVIRSIQNPSGSAKPYSLRLVPTVKFNKNSQCVLIRDNLGVTIFDVI